MPPRRFILATLVVASILSAGWLAASQLPTPLTRNVAFVCAALFAIAVIRSSLIVPWLVQRRWSKIADEHGWVSRLGRHGEPRMLGEVGDVRFILGQSTRLLGGAGGYYARTSATATIESGVPDGLRIYRQDALEWMHDLSGLRRVLFDDAELDDTLLIEGTDEDETRRWVGEHRDVLLELSRNQPRFIVYGSEVDGLPVAEGGASGAITLLVVGRKSRLRDVDALVETVTGYAARLG